MNHQRLAKLFRERAQLDLEIADALLEVEEKPARKRPRASAASALKAFKASPDAVEKVRKSLEKQGIQCQTNE